MVYFKNKSDLTMKTNYFKSLLTNLSCINAQNIYWAYAWVDKRNLPDSKIKQRLFWLLLILK